MSIIRNYLEQLVSILAFSANNLHHTFQWIKLTFTMKTTKILGGITRHNSPSATVKITVAEGEEVRGRSEGKKRGATKAWKTTGLRRNKNKAETWRTYERRT